ncbi:NUDIX hydrolase [Candidatus Woesebacteria bacterium]|nr:MAG: NUDIX hydrolase [Candidatus Woesebacteria bacterium]
MIHKKVAVIVWTIDPVGKRRFLIRHNKPFNGYDDEWTIIFGDIKKGESLKIAAKKETSEEYGINTFDETKNLDYKIEFDGKHGPTEAHFIALKVKDIDIQIILYEESIGYDWMLIERVYEVMKHEDEKQAFTLL